ncbi:hydroxymyristoyl-ACP dehydratase [Legionella jordanis]|uniref:(3R)-hydroxymyristoyl-ACP dehydratase n=1 Tax=Legionella jordanis TaxID=456 RepID=A0A0W0VCK8_9GAMM|nr:hydroxymyristoyl-ACP dehydratase [Legionella jordanis]KTD17613.1 (3R)-hydroxymyristoyl-ACP dehydratase [Legionella jordanis]RMX00896.1 hydroxymyristoyl-ACP dehydratase [Legionella jordanis]VEH11465.1 (3R)-hydroxymyristoyl-ACP dehydratase [Legionella jordanis]HAT8714918.1 hydroxymyristoyl-ACP dehydratase [Legionella jordanis]
MRFLFVDRVLQLIPGELTRGIKHITQDDFYLQIADNGEFCFIPSLIGETLGQLAAWNVMQFNGFSMRPVAGVVASAKLHRPAYVGETLELESVIERLDESAVLYNSVAKVGQDIVFTVEGALGPLLPMQDFISDEEIRRQFQEINRPGEWPETQHKTARKLALNPFLTSKDNLPCFNFEHILSCEPGVCLIAEKRITRAAPYFPDHFPNKPVLPMTVLLECKLNLAREFIRRAGFTGYHISELRKIKMNDFIHPGDVVQCQVKLKEKNDEQLILSFRSEVEAKRVCVLDVVMTTR